ncbi:MAG: hypothetical protein A2X84_02545 [Desulfuromonadaceae bacterium GWC2_58_13]|nr:MAG: hypothetical protein A2X84_02545 [Desulfuromonadaceae bacterium GWC2_58_13]
MMKGKWLRLLILLSCLVICGAASVLADDLDDDISKFTDDSVSTYDELGKADRNVNFIVQDAKSRGEVRAKAGQAVGGSDQKSANMNSVIMGAGGTVRGDIIIIDQSKGDKTQVVE